jgi:excisionase family DNA binding protein
MQMNEIMLLTMSQVAEMFSISKASVYRMVADGRLKSYRGGHHRLLMVSQEDVETVLHKRLAMTEALNTIWDDFGQGDADAVMRALVERGYQVMKL